MPSEGLPMLTMSLPPKCFVFDGPVLHPLCSLYQVGLCKLEMIVSHTEENVKRILNIKPVNSGCVAGFRHLTSHLREPLMPPEKAPHEHTASMSVPKSQCTAEIARPGPSTEEIPAEGIGIKSTQKS
ncbi:Hypothetical predicted protein [Octopus vulgaris]|uniref:Uncharacterized protein n=1 Tax=Octopus vulgaris TaxID=6645 RepID=A0AA36BMV0_OCTVU|nr:Hypothetical predicted protein [Octopus vulgaris]